MAPSAGSWPAAAPAADGRGGVSVCGGGEEEGYGQWVCGGGSIVRGRGGRVGGGVGYYGTGVGGGDGTHRQTRRASKPAETHFERILRLQW